MAETYIQPIGVIYLLKGIPFDKNYNDTLFSFTTNEQFQKFVAYKEFEFNNQMYQRVNKNTIRVQALADDIIECNYLMFQNGPLSPYHYSYKWYYAFIDSINYINEHCSEIEYTIDVMQSFLFDYNIKNAFVEREHVLSDKIFEHSKTDFNISGEYVYNEYMPEGYISANEKNQYFRGGVLLGGLVMSKPLPWSYYVEGNIVSSSVKNDRTQTITNDSHLCYVRRNEYQYTPVGQAQAVDIGYSQYYDYDISNVPNNAFIYIGFPLGNTENYINYNELLTPDIYIQPTSMQTILQDISSGVIDNLYKTGEGSGSVTLDANDIIGVFTYPLFLGCKDRNYSNVPTSSGGNKYNDIGTLSMRGDITVKFNKGFTTNISSQESYTYYPKNNKCYCYPYNMLSLSDNNEKISDYKFEYFDNTDDETASVLCSRTFQMNGVVFPQPSINLSPKNYKNRDVNYNESMSMVGFPQPSYLSNNYVTWWNDNKNQLSLTMALSALSSVVGILKGIGGAYNYLNEKDYMSKEQAISQGRRGGYMAVGGITSILATKARGEDISQNVSAFINQAQNSYLSSERIYKFSFFKKQLKVEYIKTIDDYFSMFGYTIEATKQPQIFKAIEEQDDKVIRTKYNYIKATNLSFVEPKMPDDFKMSITQIFSNGIRFWNNISDFGDYDNNNIPAPTTTI